MCNPLTLEVRLVDDLRSNATIKTKIEWSILRHSNSPDVKPESKSEKIVDLPAYIGEHKPCRFLHGVNIDIFRAVSNAEC